MNFEVKHKTVVSVRRAIECTVQIYQISSVGSPGRNEYGSLEIVQITSVGHGGFELFESFHKSFNDKVRFIDAVVGHFFSDFGVIKCRIPSGSTSRINCI